MKSKFFEIILALSAALLTLPALAQTQTLVTDLIANHGTLVAGDVTFSNFALAPAPIAIANPPVAPPLNGVDNLVASAAVNADGTISLVFTAIDPATGAPSPIKAASLQSIAYDLTVTNPAFLVNTVNQDFGPATITGFNFLQYREPPPSVVTPASGVAGDVLNPGTLILDTAGGLDQNGAFQVERTGVLFPHIRSCDVIINGIDFGGMFGGPNGCATLLPGGNRASLGLQNFFGVITDRHSFLPGIQAGFPISLDGIAIKLTLVPAGSAVTPIPVKLQAIDVSIAGNGRLTLANTLDATGVAHPGYAPAGGLPIALTTSNAAALPLLPAVTMPQGSRIFNFPVADAQIDVATPATATATLNGATVTQTVTVNPAVPLTLTGVSAGVVQGLQSTIQLTPLLNRTNLSPSVISLSSSNPAIAPVPASITLPAFSAPGAVFFRFPYVPQGTATQVTIAATFNRVTVIGTTNLPASQDFVKITKAELVVKSGSLKVQASSTFATAVLTLFNAQTGQLIGIMTNTGPSGVGAKYSFQGNVPSIKSLLLKSSLNGTATSAVAQK